MQLPHMLKAKPTVAVFWAWIALCICSWIVSALDGSLQEQMLAAVDYAVTEGAVLVEGRDATAKSFIYISLAYFLVVTLLGGLLVHFAAAGKTWAFVLLVPAALWWAYESASAPFELGQMYPGSIQATDWVFAVLGAVVWLFIAGYSARQRMRSAI